jgi:two-component system, LytTR family, response regulator
MKLRAYLVDDEPLALNRLRRLLEQTGRAEVIGDTTVPEEAVAALTRNPPDVCFLDIQMPRLNGFEVLAGLAQPPIVVFTTAWDNYALQAFSVDAVDYLLKPIEPEMLERALSKVERTRGSVLPAQPGLQALLRQITDSLRQTRPECTRPEYPSRIASRLGDRLRFLDLDQVSHFYAEDKLTYAVSDGKPHCVDYTIAELEKKLDPGHFVRIHRGTLVNFAWIREVASLPGGALNLRLRDNTQTDLTVARDRARDFKARAGL